MTVYLDSSVILSFLLQQKNQLKTWGQWDHVCCNQICRLEASRTFHRFRLENKIDDDEMLVLMREFAQMLEQVEIIDINHKVLEYAAKPFALPLGSLDAIHLASAMLWEEDNNQKLTFLTHDLQLGRAALASGLSAQGFDNKKRSRA